MSKVIQLFKKEVDEDRPTLYINHETGKVSGTPFDQQGVKPEFGDRLERIKTSLEKINRLMAELKNMERTR